MPRPDRPRPEASSRSLRGLLSRLRRSRNGSGGSPTPAVVAHAAGQAEAFEALEPRQLLFQFTIQDLGPDPATAPIPGTPYIQSWDPTTGLGTVQAWFSVINPYRNFTQDLQPQQPQELTETLDSLQGLGAGATILPAGPLEPGQAAPLGQRVLGSSRLRFTYLQSSGASVTVTPTQVTVPPQGESPAQGNSARLVIPAGQTISLQFALGSTRVAYKAFARTLQFNLDLAALTGGVPTATLPAGLQVELQRRDDLAIADDPTNAASPVFRTVTSFAANTLAGQPVPNAQGDARQYRRYSLTTPSDTPFDTVLFRNTTGASITLLLDNPTATPEQQGFGPLTASRVFGVAISYIGPAGSTVNVRDLYDRPIRPLLDIGLPAGGGQVALVDPDDTGRPVFNDGLGRVLITGADQRSMITMVGFNVQSTSGNLELVDFSNFGDDNPDRFAFNGGAVGVFPTSITGLYDAFEGAGFGFAPPVPGETDPIGLPPGPGSLILGAPWLRTQATGDVSSILPYDFTPPYRASAPGVAIPGAAVPGYPPNQGRVTFSNPNHGVQVVGSAFGSINVLGLVHGSSRVDGGLRRFAAGSMLGSLAVAGDLGSLYSATDAGVWVADDGSRVVKTNGLVNVQRSLGQVAVGARSLLDVNVVGNLVGAVGPQNRDIYRYRENEWAQFTAVPLPTTVTVRSSYISLFNATDPFAQPVLFNNGFLRNDRLLSAEFIGSPASAVEVIGTLGRLDPVNTAQDGVDVYAFAAEPGRDVLITGDFALGVNVRVLDQDGRTLASPEGLVTQNGPGTAVIRFRAPQRGVYFLAIQAPLAGDGTVARVAYAFQLNGVAPVTFGSYRTAAGLGDPLPPAFNPTTSVNVSVLSGNLGEVRVGTAYVTGGGAEADPTGSFNVPDEGAASEFFNTSALGFSTISVGSGNLYAVTTGGDIKSSAATRANFIIGGSVGRVTVGLSPIVATLGPLSGDLRHSLWRVNGTIGSFDVRGGIGINQRVEPPEIPGSDLTDTVTIRTGLDPTGTLRGDIGFIRVGSSIFAPALTITTRPGSVVGGLAVYQDRTDFDTPFQGIWGGVAGQGINLGANSDLRFFDSTIVDGNVVPNVRTPLIPDQPVPFTDDAGARYTMTLRTGATGAGSGDVVVLPINGSQGQAAGRVRVNLAGGARLEITSQLAPGQTAPGPRDVISIGRIEITDATIDSSIVISGPIEIDVWRIVQTQGQAFGVISNSTPRGDIVSVDVGGLNALTIISGNLGRTQMPASGPQLIGPFVGINTTIASNTAGGPIGVPQGLVPLWNGALYRPLGDLSPQNRYADDVGLPVDPYLDGLRVRTGDVISVSVGGAIGDIIVADGALGPVTADADGTPSVPGAFDGVVGNIYAERVFSVDVGAGLAGTRYNPLAGASIAASDDIRLVTATRPGADLRGVIIAGNSTINAGTGGFAIDGIGFVTLPGGGSLIGAFVGSITLGAWWNGVFTDGPEIYTGTLFSISTASPTPANGPGIMLRTVVEAGNINNITLRGAFDASLVTVASDIILLEAAEFRNSTLAGGEQEVFDNRVRADGSLITLRTVGAVQGAPGTGGDIADLNVEVRNLVQTMLARNYTRLSLSAGAGIDTLFATGAVRASTISGGFLRSATVTTALNSSIISVAGVIDTITADVINNSSINASGPDGRINRVTSRGDFTGSVSSSGPIDVLESTAGDVRLRLDTAFNTRGFAAPVNIVRAARDLVLTGDVAGPVNRLEAGRHIGDRFAFSSILLRGNVAAISAPNGTLYADIRIGGTLASAVFGSVDNRPGTSILGTGSIVAFGRIETVNVTGDWAGSIISYSGGIGSVTITDGSLVRPALIAAFAGDLGTVNVVNGNLLGDLYADGTLFFVNVSAPQGSPFGDIGINPARSASTAVSPTRNQLPPGVAAGPSAEAPSIRAGKNLGRVTVSNGSIFGAVIQAARGLGQVIVSGNLASSGGAPGPVIAAGSSIFRVSVGGSATDATIIAGLRSLGDDNRPGGTGSAADTVGSGRIETIEIAGNATNVLTSAGIGPGPDGVYATSDDRVTIGLSYIRGITAGGAVSNVVALADSPIVTFTPGVVRGGSNAINDDPDLSDGFVTGVRLTSGVPFNATVNGVAATLLYEGSGAVWWDAATNRLQLISTRLTTTLTVTAAAGATLTDFSVVTNDDASMGPITINAGLAGASRVVVDAYSLGVTVNGNVSGTTQIRTGMNNRGVTVNGSLTGGTFTGAFWLNQVTVTGEVNPASPGDVRIDALAAGTLTFGGRFTGVVSVDRDLNAVNVTGNVINAGVRTGNNLGSFRAGGVVGSRIAAGDNLGSVTVTGSTDFAQFVAGVDLGSDAAWGGAGAAADNGRAGVLGPVVVGGNFARSSAAAGVLRGPDGFFGTPDDSVAPGLSAIASVTVGGAVVGSNQFSEQYRVTTAGFLGPVTVAGQPAQNAGNFRVEGKASEPTSILIADVSTQQNAGSWTATIRFNQPMDASTIGPALSIREIRDAGATILPDLVEGTDYVIGAYDPATNSVTITFSPTITNRPLVTAGVPGPNQTLPATRPPSPGPGVYQFRLNADVLRAANRAARLNSAATGVGASDYVANRIVGDAGDELSDRVTNLGTTQNPALINDYSPIDLDLVLRDPRTARPFAAPNVVNTIRGVIGDHPNAGTASFQAAADIDLYQIRLYPGQFLRLSPVTGVPGTSVELFTLDTSGGTPELANLTSDDAIALAADAGTAADSQGGQTWLIRSISSTPTPTDPTTFVIRVTGNGASVGSYAFNIEIFQDANSGFAAQLPTNATNGVTPQGQAQAIPDAPRPNEFPAGTTTLVRAGYTFTLNPDNTVTGASPDGTVFSSRSGNTLRTIVNSSIGPRGFSGRPGTLYPDVDIYALNADDNGVAQAVPAGRRITVRVKLADLGADLGSINLNNAGSAIQSFFENFPGQALFGVFDITDATNITDAQLVASPSDFSPTGGRPGTIASGTNSSYGFDENGDFFLTFVTPGRIGGAPGEAAKYAIYLQGVYNTDYSIEYTQTLPGAPVPGPVVRGQNILLETGGGTVNWLERGGISTALSPFDARVLGYTGTIAALGVDQYFINNIRSTVQGIFTSANLDVTISTNPADFEGEDYSVIYLTASDDPTTIIRTPNFGASQHVDSFNLDRNDQAVVFLPAFNLLGLTPSTTDADIMVSAISAAVTRRAGELMGVRLTDPSGPNLTTDPLSTFSPLIPGILGGPANFSITNGPSNLASISSQPFPIFGNSTTVIYTISTNTQFFLGQQNAFDLLRKFVGTI